MPPPIRLCCLLIGLYPALAAAQPNIVVIIADDLGVDMISAYNESGVAPCTPNIDAIATDGLLFRNAWANPSCSPTRAALLTGRYGFRTGVGSPGGVLNTDETTIPELLDGYDNACIGKWHLGGGRQGPNNAGYTHFAGVTGGGVADYYDWTKNVNGRNSNATTYTTIEFTDDAIDTLNTLEEPFFLHLAYNAPHTPLQAPPAQLCPDASACPDSFCADNATDDTTVGRAMAEAMDTEIGRFLNALDQVDPDAIVVFIGDNGTAGLLVEPPFLSRRAKGSVYEGGVNVPFIIKGPGIATGETAAIVSCVDLFPTVAQLAGAPVATTIDGTSLLPIFTDPAATVRTAVYTESFNPNNGEEPEDYDQAIRNDRFKLIRRLDTPDEFYDLSNDPFEQNNLLPTLSVQQQNDYDALVDAMNGLVGSACLCELDGDTEQVDIRDLLAFVDLWLEQDPRADAHPDGIISIQDLLVFLDCWLDDAC